MAASALRLRDFWQPRFWPLWLGFGFLRLVSALPARGRAVAGSLIGRLLWWGLPRRRRVAEINLRLCFPDLSPAERHGLLAGHFAALGHGFVDFGLAIWASDAQIAQMVRIEGIEHLRPLVAAGRGIVLLSAHHGSLEVCGRQLCQVLPRFAALYRPSRNPWMDAFLRCVRSRGAHTLIPKDDMRQLVRRLRQGHAVWYAPDQAHRRGHAALVPFFGEPAMTNTALSEIARLGRAAVVPLYTRREAGTGQCVVEILPALADFPGASAEADALRTNQLLEAFVRKAPEQYYWIHRRFKGRPAPLPDPYR